MRILALSSFNLILLVAIDLITSAALVSSAPSTSVMHRTTRHFARDDNHDMVDLGCYRDSFTFKILNGSSQTGLTDLTNDGCIQMCANQGFAYAGTENGDRCCKLCSITFIFFYK